MRFHVVALPHTQTSFAFSACAYTVKVINFCRMMMDRGHTVVLYAGEHNAAPCSEHVVCLSEEERKALCGPGDYTSVPFNADLPQWKAFNQAAIADIRARMQPHDFLCLIGGWTQKPIADQVPLMAVEFGVGYAGVFSNFRVFESYAWMHTVYGAQKGDAHAVDGRWYDAVIPGYLDPAMFPFQETKDDYLLFVGRLIDRKGVQVAVDTARALGLPLKVAGSGPPPPGCDYVGVVGPEDRGRLMAGAKALLCPTIYIEPFGNVAIEAQACGTPVISTDWGAFTETVKQGVTGFRCRTLGEFVEAGHKVLTLDPYVIRKHVLDHYSLDVVGKLYEDHFLRLQGLWTGGWYAIPKTYPEIKIGAHYQCYKRREAVAATLKAFRTHYPEAPVCLVSDNGEDFTDLSQTFHCHYDHRTTQTGNGHSTAFNDLFHAKVWLHRLAKTCEQLTEVDWIVLLEDDVLTQDRISRLPQTSIAGPCTMPYAPALVERLKTKHPHLTIRGYSGCGGTILNRQDFLTAFRRMPSIQEGANLDPRIGQHSDALLTWVMLEACFENSLWGDHSERSRGVGLLDAAFDHQNKSHYDEAA